MRRWEQTRAHFFQWTHGITAASVSGLLRLMRWTKWTILVSGLCWISNGITKVMFPHKSWLAHTSQNFRDIDPSLWAFLLVLLIILRKRTVLDFWTLILAFKWQTFQYQPRRRLQCKRGPTTDEAFMTYILNSVVGAPGKPTICDATSINFEMNWI